MGKKLATRKISPCGSMQRKAASTQIGPPAVVKDINPLTKTWKARLGLWRPHRPGRQWTLGSDCAGYGSELLALRLLGVHKSVKSLMVCDSSASKRTLHKAMSQACGVNADSCLHVDNLCERNNADAPSVDLYCGGFPCPPWSRLGMKRGTEDPRGQVTLHGLHYVATRRPRVLLLEQVAALLDKKHKQVWDFIRKVLQNLDYEFTFKVVNTKDFGIPQSRPRLYVLAVCKESLVNPIEFPVPRLDKPDLHWFIDKAIRGTEKLELPKYERLLGPQMWSQGYILDVQASEKFQHPLRNCAPCLTKTRCKNHGYYIPKLLRRLSAVEMGRLQGLPLEVSNALTAAVAEHGLADRAFEEAVGDAMSINVLQTLLRRCCDSGGLTLGRRRDYWLDCPKDKCHQLSDTLWKKSQG